MICVIEDCNRQRVSKNKDWCNLHYRRTLRNGTPFLPSSQDRFWAKVDRNGPWSDVCQSHCWNWTAGSYKGYGRFHLNGRDVAAHRHSYELAFDRIPDGLQVDHSCHNHSCVNPEHLRLATNKQNCENRIGARQYSKSGIRGVYWTPDCHRWQAKLSHNGKSIYLGLFNTASEAEAAVIAKRNELFTHNILDRQAVS